MNIRTSVVSAFAVLAFAASAAPIIKNGEKIAFMGDSITQFGNEQDGGYVNLVIDGLERAGVKAVKIPAGVSGHKSDQMLARLDGVLAKKPDWMTLSCGVNDVGHGPRGIELEPYKKNITAILDKCAAAGVKVIILTPTLCNDGPGWEKHGYNRKLEGYCEFLRKTAAERKLPL
ncbi:MAG: SGNH/GDSL hydrolase family protein, partial [Kiritimatiellae bacterium]|nr:SGNH/GDSL hydrolase family protein [Kiritimatiellia bacterium]